MKKIILSVISLLFAISAAYAVPAYPFPIQVTQPDGTVLTIKMHGDEYLSWITCGNSLVAMGADGYYHYASFGADGVSQAQGVRVTSTPAGDGSSVSPSAKAIENARKKRLESAQASQSASPVQEVSGSNHYLVLLIQFSDREFYKTKQNFVDLLNKNAYSDNGATGSALDYYYDNSHGKFSPVFDVYGPITVSGKLEDYGNNKGYNQDTGAPALLAEACNLANNEIDFSKYDIDKDGYIDNVFFYYAGYNAAEGASGTIWPHKWYVSSGPWFDGVRLGYYACTSELRSTSGNTMCGIGTFCHEFGHVIGLPDFYDTDYEENGEGSALDAYSLMSSGNYNNNGKTPPYLTYEERRILGWDNGKTLLSEGANTLSPISANKAYYCPTGHDNEYYLFESRPTTGWDAYTYGNGMVIYHVDKSDNVLPDGTTAASKWNSGDGINIFADHQCMDLVETVPESELKYYEQMVFPGYEKVYQFNSETSPAFVAWNGSSTGYSLSDISFYSGNGTTSFTVTVERQLVGQVHTSDGLPVSGAEVTVTSVELQNTPLQTTPSGLQLTMCAPVQKTQATVLRAITDANGNFSLKLDEGGSFSVKVKKDGYVPYASTVTMDGVALNLDICLVTPAESAISILKKYDNITSYGIGNDGYDNLDYYAAAEFDSTELLEYVGNEISYVSFLAYGGETGTALEMGVKVYFGEEEVCSRAASTPVFNTMCTVDIRDCHLKIPEGKSVKLCYYLLGVSPACNYTLALADYSNGKTGGTLYKLYYRGGWDEGNWNTYTYANLVISAGIDSGKTVIELLGFNTIATQSSYTAGVAFDLTLNESSVNPTKSVTWKVNGEDTNPKGVTLPAGTHTVRAYLTYDSGRTEVIETKIKVQ